MARPYDFVDGNGDSIIPVADGDFFINEMDGAEETGHFYIEFFDDAQATIPVTPTGGTITPRGAPMGNLFLLSSAESVLNASEINAGNSVYTPPVFNGRMVRAKLTLSGVGSANFFRAIMWRVSQ